MGYDPVMYRERLSPQGEYLCLAVRGSRTTEESARLNQLAGQIGKDRCFEFAHRNKVGPIVGMTLAMEFSGALFEGRWKQLCIANQNRVQRLLNALQEVTGQLGRLSCPHAVIENGGVLLGTQTPTAAFAASDFDLLVAVEAWEASVQVMTRLGFEAADRRHPPTSRIEFKRKSASGDPVWINLGTQPFDRTWVPLQYTDRSAVWLSRRVPTEDLPGAFVLDPTDSLVLVCVHTSLHSYVRSPFLRLHADADWLVRKCHIEWGRFVEEVSQVGLSTRVWLSLEMTRFLLGTSVPAEVTAELAPRASVRSSLLDAIAREGTFAAPNCRWAGRRRRRRGGAGHSEKRKA